MRSGIRPFVCILVVALVVTLLVGISEQPDMAYSIDGMYVDDYNSTLYLPVVLMCVLVYALPVMEFSFFKKRINLDCAYALPISRKTMGAVHYLSGLVMLFSTFTASYLVNFILLLTRGPGWFDFLPMIPHFFICLLLGFSMYSFMVFVFNRANTRGDGIWFMILYSFVFAVIASAIMVIIDNNSLFNEGYAAVLWGVIDQFTQSIQYVVELSDSGRRLFWETPELIGWLIFWIFVGALSAVGFFLSFGRERTERTEEISDSFFGFRTLIPIYAVCGILLFEAWNYILYFVIIEVLAFIGYTVYRRGFHYKKSDIIILLSLFLFLIINSIINL